MNLDQDLKDALKAVGQSYRPTDQLAAREELLRRSRRRRWIQAGSAVALAGGIAALAFLVVPQQLARDEVDRSPTAQLPLFPPFGEDAEEIIVGRGVRSVAFDAVTGTLFAVNAEEGTLVSISAADNQIEDEVEVGGAPSNVAYSENEGLWVVDQESGDVVEVTGGDGSPLETGNRFTVAEPGAQMDLDVGHGFVWVASREHPFARVDPVSGDVRDYPKLATAPTDVAVGARSVWIYDSDRGNIGDIDFQTGDVHSYGFVRQVESGGAGDLVVGPGGVWVANGAAGKLFQFSYDLHLGTKIAFDGTFAGIWIGDGFVWVVSGGDGHGRLCRIDPYSADPDDPHSYRAALVDRPVEFAGDDFDVVTGADSVWVSDYDGGLITRYPAYPPSGVPGDDTDRAAQSPSESGSAPAGCTS